MISCADAPRLKCALCCSSVIAANEDVPGVPDVPSTVADAFIIPDNLMPWSSE